MAHIMTQLDLSALARAHHTDLVNLTQRLVQTPSLSGREGEVATLIQTEMQRLGYDQVTTDTVGNVVGVVRGGAAPALMFNGHMDHVDPGDLSGWPHPPFGGSLVGGELWGRATVDMKGPLAAMILAGGLAKRYQLPLAGDLVVACVVWEEMAGLGTRVLVDYLKPGLAVVGEASASGLMRGHRGRVELVVQVSGRSVHASMPELGVNPHYVLARFLGQLQNLPMQQDAVFGPASVAPTLYRSDQSNTNVTPGEVQLTLDWRSLPGQTPDQIIRALQPLLAGSLPPGAQGQVRVAVNRVGTYTGCSEDIEAAFPSFELPADHWLVTGAQQTLSQALARPVPVGVWRFATDGGHLMAAGVPTVGFGPGDPTLVHTNHERIGTDALLEGLIGYLSLATNLVRKKL
jgi:succinyl-diaminopimelate desuccinylase